MARCSRCGAVGDVLTYRRQIRPFYVELPALWLALRRGEGLIQLVALSVIMLLCWFGILLRDVLQSVLLLSYLLICVRSAADGRIKPPEPSSDQLGGTFVALMRLLVASWTIWAPILLIYTFAGDSGWLFYLTLFAGLLVTPAAILITSLGHSLVDLFSPWTLIRTIFAIGTRYWQAAGAFVASLLGLVFISANISAWLEYQPLPFIGDILLIVVAHTAQVGMLAVGAFAIGWSAFEAGGQLLLWTERDMICPQLPDATPRGRSVRRREDALDDALNIDMELSQGDPLPIADPATVIERPTGLERAYDIDELPVDLENVQLALSESAPETLSSVLAQGDRSRVLAIYDGISRASGVPLSLSASERIRLGDHLVAVERFQDAAVHYRAAAQDDAKAELAPVAIVRLADLMSERLNRADVAQTLLRLLAERYPNFSPERAGGQDAWEGRPTEPLS